MVRCHSHIDQLHVYLVPDPIKIGRLVSTEARHRTSIFGQPAIPSIDDPKQHERITHKPVSSPSPFLVERMGGLP